MGVFAWPQCEGYLTVRPLQQRDRCTVWLVQRETDQQFRVLKLIDNKEAVVSLAQVAQAELSEHLIEFYGVVTTDHGPALLAEYCPGGSLGQMLQARGPLPLGEVITALAPIAHTVAALHRQGLTHQDISPNNILLTADGMPKLADFQETQLLVDPTSTAGTPGFMAPEKSDGHTSVDSAAADIYSLGACLWYLLSGKVPEPPAQRSPIDVILPQIPQQLGDLLLEALHLEPDMRPNAEQFARTLFACAQAEPLNWTASVPGFATHLMSTIHPAPAGRRPRRRGAQSKATKARDSRTMPIPRLKFTPGSRKLLVAAVLGVVLIIGTGAGVRWWVHSNPDTVSQNQQIPQAPAAQSCAIQSDAQLPPCAQDQTQILTDLVKLSGARDAALNSADAEGLRMLYTQDSDQLHADLSMLEKLSELGLSLQGLHTRLDQLEITARSYPDVVIIAGLSFPSQYNYRFTDQQQIAHRAKAGGGESVRFELQEVDGQWRISRVLQRAETGSVGPSVGDAAAWPTR